MNVGLILDMLILLGLVGGLALGLRRGLAKMLVSVVMLFLSTLFAALLYGPVIGIFVSGNTGSLLTGGVIVFFGLLLVFYSVLEYTVHRNYPGLRFRRLGRLDNLLGLIVGAVWSILAVSLLVLVIDYGSQLVGGPGSLLTEMIRQSRVTPLLRELFKAPLALIRIFFPAGVPNVLLYFTT